MLNKVLLKETMTYNTKYLINHDHYGDNFALMKDNIRVSLGQDGLNNILRNVRFASLYIANPLINNNRSKHLALGKVQSGKTMFFLSLLAYSFDNGYKLGIVFGGTKNSLLEQNNLRIRNEFNNNKNVVVISFNDLNVEEVRKHIEEDKRVIITILKNVSSKKSNLHLLNTLIDKIKDIPTIIIDDESDEHTPGAPNSRSKKIVGITHKVISDIYTSFNNATLVFVTATPQANLLLSTMDSLTPDSISLVYPGVGYVGGNIIHDVLYNDYVQLIDDHEDFIESIPDSFREALIYFMLSTSYKRINNQDRNYSMLVHPSSLTRIQSNVVEKINETINVIKDSLIRTMDPNYDNFISYIKNIYIKYDFKVEFVELIKSLEENINHYEVFEFNTSKSGREDIENVDYSDSLHKIYVGGNMLGRGLTIPNLSTTYIYRDSKETAIDTLYQRARWLGYKQKYIDIVQVYMPESLADKFISTVESERDMWDTLERFIESNHELKDFNRVFTLNNDKLLLTRKTVSRTITYERIKGGYNYDRSIFYRNSLDITNNLNVINDLYSEYSIVESFATNNGQNHRIFSGKFSYYYEKYLKHIKFPNNSIFGTLSLSKIYEQVLEGVMDDKINILIMRDDIGQYRQPNASMKSIKELPQGYNVSSNYNGDRNLGYSLDCLELQIHKVYIDKSKPDKIIPMFAINNPFTKYTIRYVTGENYNEN